MQLGANCSNPATATNLTNRTGNEVSDDIQVGSRRSHGCCVGLPSRHPPSPDLLGGMDSKSKTRKRKRSACISQAHFSQMALLVAASAAERMQVLAVPRAVDWWDAWLETPSADGVSDDVTIQVEIGNLGTGD